MINLLIVASMLIMVTGIKKEEAHAFQPVSHYILMKKTTERLKKDSIIRKALETYPKIAAWGANGPDLGLIQPGEIFGYSPWSSAYHYFKVGSLTARQLQNALKSGDLKKIAFAAGWATHVGGDLGCHGIFVNPECGVYLDKPEGRPLHIALERAAEPYLWVNMGGYLAEDYKNGVADLFADASEIPFDVMIQSSREIHGDAPSETEARNWATVLNLGLKTGVGYKYSEYDEAVKFLSSNNRISRLENAFYSALERCIEMLTSAEEGIFDVFKDRWNLDVGRSDSPISNLTVNITTGKNRLTDFGTGTDDYVYFGMELKDGTKKEWSLDNGKNYGITVNDFESGNIDKFYLYMDKLRKDVAPNSVKKIYLRKEKFESSLGHDWYPEHMIVFVNGQTAFDMDIKEWINDEHTTYEREVDFSSIVGIPDDENPAPVINVLKAV
ncbi:PLAT/LH2 domain-containing protein [Clostridium sp. FP1]|uniref:PLAT/LH2 domain-containing protein n=1 Tax=Clostridium sp. FP1 TaxID=2724076 RepID=UPI0013E953A0|nr:PLAT/LH2 domain-containing protein [Clostridium sp. FP1]MBZ9634056.1 zinc dependent phospholipase C family protein [Clostridium sp. FP1]